MSDSCCGESGRRSRTARPCPVSGYAGRQVEWSTVAALAAGEVPPRQKFWICGDPDCALVYFGDADSRLGASELRVRPGFKQDSDDGLVCYCFLHRRSDLEAELREHGETTIPERIIEEVRAGNCACSVRNPSGKCCLNDVRKAVEELRQRLAS